MVVDFLKSANIPETVIITLQLLVFAFFAANLAFIMIIIKLLFNILK